MDKAFQPESFENKIYELWEKSDVFSAQDQSLKPAFSIVLPPPNVTGVLHNGHALMVTIQDILIRWKRMNGYNALWLPGTDHAGIATQMVVERALTKEGKTRSVLGRKAFLEQVWKWKEKHGNTIIQQMKKLGASPDWNRLCFTMDPSLSKVVREAFVQLYEAGLVYRGRRIINWCHRCHTALSDLEVIPTEKKGKLWHIAYELDGFKQTLIIATTRPETMLGDTAVAVHPEDERYKKLVGKKIKLPLVGRLIPVVADPYVDQSFGSGALKVTPGHDFNDFEIGERHKLPVLSVFDKSGKVNDEGKPYTGLKILEVREKILEDLKSSGLLIKEEDHVHHVGVCQRCEQIAEPLVSDQWFIKTKPLAAPAIEAVKRGEKLSLNEVDLREDCIKIIPEGWVNTYYQWMENIRDWCISRQLWWGHQIPAWYCNPCGKTTVSREDVKICSHCKSSQVAQDEDVLDTWFSSGLWPFSTLGWPENTQAMKTFYPTSIMETGFDILFFWVARMSMLGLYFNNGRVPFKRVYLHAMVRDEKGQKMSKTKGNVVDPLDLIRDYGADAFRFTLAAMAGQGRDIKLSLERIEGYKAFCNKIWNASRYVLLKLEESKQELPQTENLELLFKNINNLHPNNSWICSRLNIAIEKVSQSLEEFKLNEAAQELFSFIWHEYCDWYIEFSKELLKEENYTNQTQVCLFYVLQEMLKLAHPFIPFITEEIFKNLKDSSQTTCLALESFPKVKHTFNPQDYEKVELWKQQIDKLRSFRGENNVSPKAKLNVWYDITEPTKATFFMEGIPFIKSLAQLERLEEKSPNIVFDDSTSQISTASVNFYIPLKGVVDPLEELKRLEKEKNTALEDIVFVKNKLSNEAFINKAPQTLVEKEKLKLLNYETRLQEISATIQRLQKS